MLPSFGGVASALEINLRTLKDNLTGSPRKTREREKKEKRGVGKYAHVVKDRFESMMQVSRYYYVPTSDCTSEDAKMSVF